MDSVGKTCPTATQDIIPVIDIAGLTGAKAERLRVAAQLGLACRETGFFYVSNHGVPTSLIDKVLCIGREFFALPDEIKSVGIAAASKCRHGYEPLQEQTLEAGTPPDLKEGFSMGPDVEADDPLVVLDPINHGPNQWPVAPAEFRPVMLEYLEAVQGLAERILRGLALSLGLAADYFEDYLSSPAVVLRLLRYPPQPSNPLPAEKGCGAHTDWGALTLLLQDSAGGLEVQHQKLGWVKASPIEGTYVVNIGDLLARWTNGLYRSTTHRVVNYSGRERYSVPFFYIGRSDHKIACIPECNPEGKPPLFAPTTVMGHMEDMIRATFA